MPLLPRLVFLVASLACSLLCGDARSPNNRPRRETPNSTASNKNSTTF